MASGVSSLNPHAVSYIPLSKRVVADIKNSSFLEGTTKTAAGISSTTLSAPPGTQGQYQKSTYDLHESESFPSSGNFASRSHPAAHGSSSQNPTGVSDYQISAMEFEMDMDYLEMSFPDLSERFILDVYIENDGHLESAVDMLNHVEFFAFENPENEPESLEIGEVAEPGAATEPGSLKQKNVTDEATTTST